MLRPVLDPATARRDEWPELSFSELAPKIRAFGYVADARALLPADVLLVTRVAVGPWLIRRAQGNFGFAAADAHWTHAGLYTGDDMVVDANPIGGVRLRPMVEMTARHLMLVRRAPGLTIEQRYRVVVKALAHLRRGYSLLAIPQLAWRAWRRPGPMTRGHVGGVTICSTLVSDAFAEAAQLDIRPRSRGASWPADLSHTAKLADVAVGWVKVAR